MNVVVEVVEVLIILNFFFFIMNLGLIWLVFWYIMGCYGKDIFMVIVMWVCEIYEYIFWYMLVSKVFGRMCGEVY